MRLVWKPNEDPYCIRAFEMLVRVFGLYCRERSMYKYHGGIGADYVLRGQDMHLELLGGNCKVFNERLSTRINMNYRSEIIPTAWKNLGSSSSL